MQAMMQDKSALLFMDQLEASMICKSLAKFGRESLLVKFLHQLVESLERFSSRFEIFCEACARNVINSCRISQLQMQWCVFEKGCTEIERLSLQNTQRILQRFM